MFVSEPKPVRHAEQTTIVSVPLPLTLAQRLRDRALDNDRHVAGELRRIIRDALAVDDPRTAAAPVNAAPEAR